MRTLMVLLMIPTALGSVAVAWSAYKSYRVVQGVACKTFNYGCDEIVKKEEEK